MRGAVVHAGHELASAACVESGRVFGGATAVRQPAEGSEAVGVRAAIGDRSGGTRRLPAIGVLRLAVLAQDDSRTNGRSGLFFDDDVA